MCTRLWPDLMSCSMSRGNVGKLSMQMKWCKKEERRQYKMNKYDQDYRLTVQEAAAVEVGKSWQNCEVDESLAKTVEVSCRRAAVIIGRRSDCM